MSGTEVLNAFPTVVVILTITYLCNIRISWKGWRTPADGQARRTGLESGVEERGEVARPVHDGDNLNRRPLPDVRHGSDRLLAICPKRRKVAPKEDFQQPITHPVHRLA